MPIEYFVPAPGFTAAAQALRTSGCLNRSATPRLPRQHREFAVKVFGVERCARAPAARASRPFRALAHPHGLKLRRCVADGDALHSDAFSAWMSKSCDGSLARTRPSTYECFSSPPFPAATCASSRRLSVRSLRPLFSTVCVRVPKRDTESDRSTGCYVVAPARAREHFRLRFRAADPDEAQRRPLHELIAAHRGRIQRKSRQRPLRGSELRGGRLDVAQSRQPIAFHDVAERRPQFLAPAPVAFVVLKVAGEHRQSRRHLSGEAAGNRRMVPSSPATIMAADSSVKRIPEMPLRPATLVTTSVSSCGASRFQTRTVLSILPLASSLPPALNARAFTDPAWADQARSGAGRSHRDPRDSRS